mgnify:CR=1 FL=1
MNKPIFILIVAIFFSLCTKAQSDALYSQYMFNQFTVNPAYAGSRDALSTVLLYRNQWVGVDNAPKTINFSAHSPFHKKNVALGINFMLDEIGPTTIQSIAGTYAYHVKTNYGDLSMGLRTGLISLSSDESKLNFYNDQYETNGIVNVIIPNFDFGMYFFTDLFYAGASVSHILEDNFILNNEQNTLLNFELQRYISVATGGVVEINKNLLYKPSFMLKFTPGFPINYDVNSSFLLNKTLWAGFSYRSTQNLILLLEWNISDQLRGGYSYDFDLSPLSSSRSGSHELFIGFDFVIRKSVPNISPKYL